MGNPWDDNAAPAPVVAPAATANPWDANAAPADTSPQANDTFLNRSGGLANRALTTALAGPTAGALIGTPAGPPGIAIGSVAGALALPLAEAGTGIYNAVRPNSWPAVGSPTKAVQDLLTKFGLPEPKNTAERVFSAAVGAVGGASSGISSAESLAANAPTAVGRGVGTAMAQQPGVQMATAPIAAATNQVVTEKTGSPILGFLTALGVGGAPALVTGKPGVSTTRADIEAQAKAHYADMENSGLNISPQSFADFVASLPGKIKGWGKFAPQEGSQTARMLGIAQKVADSGEPVTMRDLDQFHHVLNGSYSPANTKFDNSSLMQLKSAVNDYVYGLKANDLEGTGAKSPAPEWQSDEDWAAEKQQRLDAATGALKQARSLWQQNAKMRTIEEITDTAANEEDPDLYIRQRFRALKRSDDFDHYTPDEQKLIVQISNQGLLGQFGRAAPHFTPAGLVKGKILSTAGPAGVATGAGAYGSYKGAQALRQARIQALLNTISSSSPPSMFDNTALQTAPLTAFRAYGSNPLGIGASRAQSLYAPPSYTPPMNPDDELARNP